MKSNSVIGYGGEYHDSNIAIISREGKIDSVVSEERFTRVKKDGSIPFSSLSYYGLRDLPDQAIIGTSDWRNQRTVAAVQMQKRFPQSDSFLFTGHHRAHCASAYYTSGFENAIVVSMDGGSFFEPWSTTIHEGKGNELFEKHSSEECFTHSYFFTTALLGFTPNKHEGKITGLAAHGKHSDEYYDWLEQENNGGKNLAHAITEWVPKNSKNGLEMVIDVEALQKYKERWKHVTKEDIAFTVQEFTENKVTEFIAKQARVKYKNIALAGGLFANVKLNQKIMDLGFENIYVHPGMGDEGLGLGAALSVVKPYPFTLKHVFFGPGYSDDQMLFKIIECGLNYSVPNYMFETLATLLAEGKVIARYTGRTEYGPRALGNRSILYQTTDKTVNDWLNKRLKRTEFMPFAPITLEEHAHECYENIEGSQYTMKFMTITKDCTALMKRLSPAVVHIDGTARPQLVDKDNAMLYGVLSEYHKLTGIPSLINTSFNNHGEPIVNSPQDAVASFLSSGLDYLAMGPYLIQNPKLK